MSITTSRRPPHRLDAESQSIRDNALRAAQLTRGVRSASVATPLNDEPAAKPGRTTQGTPNRQPPHLADAPAPLSEQERTICESLAAGATRKQVASQLDVSMRTLESRLQAARIRLGLKSNLQLIASVTKGDRRALASTDNPLE